MNQDESDPLRHLLDAFHVRDLGEGDEVAGLNLLATMAITLANLAPADGTIATKDGRTARLGVNLLVNGPSSTGLVLDEVLTEVEVRQLNLSDHLLRYARHIEEQRGKQGASLPPMDPTLGKAVDRVAETQQDIEPLFNTRVQTWARIFAESPSENVEDLVARRKFLVTMAKPADLPEMLKGLRPGNPLVHAGIHSSRELPALARNGAALIAGHHPLGDGCELARGHFLLTDPLGMLQRSAAAPEEVEAWLGHFLWLCDGGVGPQVPAAGTPPTGPTTTIERFLMALDSVLARRMNCPDAEPLQISLDTRETKVRFREFLDGMNRHLPGISLAARNLVDTLAFGLGRMAGISRDNPRSYDGRHPFSREPVKGLEKPLPLSVEGIEAFARFLVLRMGNARAMIMHAAAIAQRRYNIERIHWKLQQGPVDGRTISRNFKIRAHERDLCMRWMERAGLAHQDGQAWILVEGARLDFEGCDTPLLDV